MFKIQNSMFRKFENMKNFGNLKTMLTDISRTYWPSFKPIGSLVLEITLKNKYYEKWNLMFREFENMNSFGNLKTMFTDVSTTYWPSLGVIGSLGLDKSLKFQCSEQNSMFRQFENMKSFGNFKTMFPDVSKIYWPSLEVIGSLVVEKTLKNQCSKYKNQCFENLRTSKVSGTSKPC